MTEESIEEVLRNHTGELMAIPGVVGTGQGRFNGRPCIKVFVEGRKADFKDKIPGEIEGYAVIIEESGTFRAF